MQGDLVAAAVRLHAALDVPRQGSACLQPGPCTALASSIVKYFSMIAASGFMNNGETAASERVRREQGTGPPRGHWVESLPAP